MAYPPQVGVGAGGAPVMANSTAVLSNFSPENVPFSDNEPPKYFFQEKYAPLNVKGNFLTLCACPKNVELGEWLAHQSDFLLPQTSIKRKTTS